MATGYQCGWIHAPAPVANVNGQPTPFDTGGLAYLNSLNHNPLDVGDNLPTPLNPTLQGAASSMAQTWWGFPTWRETLSPNWVDPAMQVNLTNQQPTGLNPFVSLNVAGGSLNSPGGDGNLLPPMANPGNFPGNFSFIRQSQQLFCDLAGQSSTFWGGAAVNEFSLWISSWEDDLIMTGVRSFDVKAYDNVLASYADLGWGDDLRVYLPYANAQGASIPSVPPFIAGAPNNNGVLAPVPWPPVALATTPFYSFYATMMHEGRMPPLPNDLRVDAQYGGVAAGFYGNNYPNYTGNIGDPSPSTIRLRRVWDTWFNGLQPGAGDGRRQRQRHPPRVPGGPAVLAAGLSVVSAAVPGPAPRHPDPDPRRGPLEPADQVADDPPGFHGQVVIPCRRGLCPRSRHPVIPCRRGLCPTCVNLRTRLRRRTPFFRPKQGRFHEVGSPTPGCTMPGKRSFFRRNPAVC